MKVFIEKVIYIWIDFIIKKVRKNFNVIECLIIFCYVVEKVFIKRFGKKEFKIRYKIDLLNEGY